LEVIVTADRIEREIIIAAPVERVWAVLTEAENVAQWFGSGVPAALELRSGGMMVLNHGEHGIYPTRIVKVDPPHHFSYRWASAFPGEDATDANSTLVEFTLTPENGQTRLALVESGFASLVIPPDRYDSASHESHSGGWIDALEALRRFAEQGRG
jgi:uncharacterized protein YndB with AHSA1/START domain